jgi:predicted small integral membrane protein
MRYLQIAAAAFIGLIGSLAFLNNLLNISSAQSFVSAVISAPEQPYYKVIGPTLGLVWQGWLGLLVIMAGELAAGVLGFIGAFRMTKSKAADSAEFQDAKFPAIAGGAIGILVWYGFFIVVGEMYFNMWQTEIGLGSVNGAFRYGTVCAVLMFFLAMRTDRSA